MNNDVLALKYRPRFFKDVMGQDIAVETLQNSLELNKIHNAFGTHNVLLQRNASSLPFLA